MSLIGLLASAALTLASGRAWSRDLPSSLTLRGSEDASAAPWAAQRQSDVGKATDSTTLVYQLIAYVMKEVLDDASEEYRGSPVGVYLRREALAENSRSTQPWSKPILFIDSPASLRYRVRGGTTLGDLWSSLGTRPEAGGRRLSLDPKVGAGKMGFVLGLHW